MNQLFSIYTQLIPRWHGFWEFSSLWNPSSKFWCKHMPPNFGIKVILFQNYHVCIPNWSIVMGREPRSGVHCLSPLASIHERMPQNFLQEHHCFTGIWIHPSRPAIKCLSNPGERNSTIQPCLSSTCLLECSRLRWTLHGLSFSYEDLKRLEEFLCIGWLCRSFERLIEQEDHLLRLEEFLWYHLSLLFMLTKMF